MPTQVAINGFGGTGRATFRAAYDQGADLEWVGINDVMDIQMLAHLLRHDSVYGPFPGRVEVLDNNLVVDDHRIPMYSETVPAELPWGDIGAQVVIESSGHSATASAQPSTSRQAPRRVIVSAPAKQPDVTVALGINFENDYDPEFHNIISNASCTTNCLAPWRRCCTRRSASATAS